METLGTNREALSRKRALRGVCSILMPVRKVKGGWRWGQSGKVYRTKSQAARQGRAIRAAQAKRKKKGS